MKHKILFFFLFLLTACMVPAESSAQCASIYQRGVSMMKHKRYQEAIKLFKSAKTCDGNLAAQCDAKIKSCYRYISKSKKEEVEEVVTLVVKPTNLELSAGDTAGQLIKVQSMPEDWKVTSSPDWCRADKNGENKLSLTCEVNNSASVRVGEVVISNGKSEESVTITQLKAPDELNITDETGNELSLLDFTREGRTVVVKLHTNAKWKISNKSDWVEVISEDPDQLVLRTGAVEDVRYGYLTLITQADHLTATLVVAQSEKNEASLKKKVKKEEEKRRKNKK